MRGPDAKELRLLEDLERAIADAALLADEACGIALILSAGHSQGSDASARSALDFARRTANVSQARAARLGEDLQAAYRKHGGIQEGVERARTGARQKDDLYVSRGLGHRDR